MFEDWLQRQALEQRARAAVPRGEVLEVSRPVLSEETLRREGRFEDRTGTTPTGFGVVLETGP